jgi:hypothetical protein
MPLFKFIVYLIIISNYINSCSSANLYSKKVFRTGVNILYGEISSEELFAEFPRWKELYDEYVPDSKLVSSISSATADIKVEIFLGTWCGDSRREVPKFLKIADQCDCFGQDNIRLWAVDRNKSLDSGLSDDKKIKRVATFIFLRNGVEIGRIVERIKSGSLEQDIYEILKG